MNSLGLYGQPSRSERSNCHDSSDTTFISLEMVVVIHTSDPDRASVILVQNREYVDSGREYGNGYVTAYSCIFTETLFNTKTHESAVYQQILEPGFTIRVSGDTYYEGRMTLDDEYYDWRNTGLS